MPSQKETKPCQAAVDAWADDVAAGRETGLYAWRRANVAELNALARRWMADSGRLSGPELASPMAPATGRVTGWLR